MTSSTDDGSNPPNIWMWVGKLAPPYSQLESVPREALLADLQAHVSRPLTLVVSAPGFGKTTLLAQWRSRLLQLGTSTHVAWVSLDEADAEVNRFLSYVLLALEGAGLDIGSLSELARSQTLDQQPQRTVAALLQMLEQQRSIMTLFLDDYHRAGCVAVDEVVGTLLERGGHRLRLVVSSRTRPSWPLAAMRVRGLVYELNATGLPLTISEAAQIFGGTLQESSLAALHAKTEGWAVALQLAKIWFAQGRGSVFGLASFSGSVPEIAEYLTEQIVNSLSGRSREFLLDTSLLERFNADLADEVRDQSDSTHIMGDLMHLDALLVPLDASRSWFRYHLLLADFLQTRLSVARAREVHCSAARWLARHDDLALAVAHALAAGDVALAVHLVSEAGGWELTLLKGIRYTCGLLQQFNDVAKLRSPELCLMEAYLQAKLGNETLAFEFLHRTSGNVLFARDHDVIEGIVHLYFDRFDDHNRWPVRAEVAQRRFPGDALAQAMLLCVGAVSSLAWGRMDDAVPAARAARIQMRLVTSSLGENYCLMHEALAHAIRGEPTRSRQLVEEALLLAETNFGTECSIKGIVGCFKAQHLYWQGEWNQTQSWILDGQEILTQTDGWMDVFATHVEVDWRVSLRRDGLSSAMAVLEAATHTGERRHLNRLVGLAQAWRVDLLAQCGLTAQAKEEARRAKLELLADQVQLPSSGWRQKEAATLALARLSLSLGASAAALARLEAATVAFERAGLFLPAWRFRLLALIANRNAPEGGVDAVEVKAALAPVREHGLLGLLLEAGPAILPLLPDPTTEVGQFLGTAVSQLRGWRARPVRQRAQFSAKEMQVLLLLAHGQSNKEIARSLDVSENTVKFHLKHIFRKLEVDGRVAAISRAIRLGLLTP